MFGRFHVLGKRTMDAKRSRVVEYGGCEKRPDRAQQVLQIGLSWRGWMEG